MKTTGIIKRIDDLGRVVIPKEIRSNLNIRENDPLEIFVSNDGEVTLKKYSTVKEQMFKESEECIDALSNVTGRSVFITDTDRVVVSRGKFIKQVLRDAEGNKINDDLKALIEDSTFQISMDTRILEKSDTTAVFVVPIKTDNDIIGVIGFAKESKDDKVEDADLNLLRVVALYLGKRANL